eukprot:TRINITY_DN25668_c0_g2_i1.p1 TRINITY_DN25668_c0_g2~~TRINITY_DN25668_c0_g2_i1.p1  ORF type:complete len:569 (+),score=72.85 TRINITY_DN25668_c0_g2_i1:47-1708(+)
MSSAGGLPTAQATSVSAEAPLSPAGSVTGASSSRPNMAVMAASFSEQVRLALQESFGEMIPAHLEETAASLGADVRAGGARLASSPRSAGRRKQASSRSVSPAEREGAVFERLQKDTQARLCREKPDLAVADGPCLPSHKAWVTPATPTPSPASKKGGCSAASSPRLSVAASSPVASPTRSPCGSSPSRGGVSRRLYRDGLSLKERRKQLSEEAHAAEDNRYRKEADDILSKSWQSHSSACRRSHGSSSSSSHKIQGDWSAHQDSAHVPGRKLVGRHHRSISPTTIKEAAAPASQAEPPAALVQESVKHELETMKQQLGLLLLGADMLKRRMVSSAQPARAQAVQSHPSSPDASRHAGSLAGQFQAEMPTALGSPASYCSGYAELQGLEASLYTPSSTQRSFAVCTPQGDSKSRPAVPTSSLTPDRSAKYVGYPQDETHQILTEGAFATAILPPSPQHRVSSPRNHSASSAVAVHKGANFVQTSAQLGSPARGGACTTPCSSPATPVAVYMACPTKAGQVQPPKQQCFAVRPPHAQLLPGQAQCIASQAPAAG